MQLATPGKSRLGTSPQSTPTSHSSSPRDKPLPSPPIVQVILEEPIEPSATLIDAKDKPLRQSPRAAGEEPKEWPVLTPDQPQNPGTLQQLMQESGTELRRQSTIAPKERYPKLGDITKKISEEQLPVSRYSSKSAASASVNSATTVANGPMLPSSETQPTRNASDKSSGLAAPSDLQLQNDPTSTSPSKLSASAAAVEKSTMEARRLSDPRQARTSSLRARLSAGQIVKDGQSKVVGFTDFTSQLVPLSKPAQEHSYRVRKEAQKPPCQDFAIKSDTNVPVVTGSALNAPALGHRAPAQFVAGSRRPVQPRRPGSRNGIRSDAHPPAFTSLGRPISSRAQNTAPSSVHTQGPYPLWQRDAQSRKSSIPIPSHIKVNSKGAPTLRRSEHSNRSDSSTTAKKVPRNEFTIYQDDSVLSLVNRKSKSPAGHAQLTSSDEGDKSGSNSSPESSPERYKTKRLSKKTLEYGPTLKISSSAERYIMGNNSDKENVPLIKSKVETDDKMFVSGQKINGFITSTIKKSRSRHLSSHSLLQSVSQKNMLSSSMMDKKTRSVDLSAVLSPRRKASPTPSRHNTDASTKASSTNDPFFDAQEHLCQSENSKALISAGFGTVVDEDPWISPMAVQPDKRLNVGSNADIPTVDGPEKFMNKEMDVSDLLITHAAHTPDVGMVHIADGNTKKQIASPKESTKTPVPKTRPSPASYTEHPPRSSSRVHHVDFTNARPPKPHSTTREVPQTPPKDFGQRQNNLGSHQGLASSQIDIRKSASKRGSFAHESSRSHHSVSKTVLSNFRGFFSKHPSKETLKSQKARASSQNNNKNRKFAINGTGSPFPLSTDARTPHRPDTVSQSHLATPLASTSDPNVAAPGDIEAKGAPATVPETPSIVSPTPTEVSMTTNLAMQILDSARNEQSSPRKEHLLELGKVMVDAITQARDAEKAMVEATQAARRAEVANALCQGSLKDVTRIVEGELGLRARN